MRKQHIDESESRILIVDDIPENLRLLTMILKAEGYNVRQLRNGKMVMSSALSSLPDLILLDILMPEIDGYEVCLQLKAQEKTCDIPIIFISALDQAASKTKAFAVGGVDYITKPFQEEEVLARVKTHLALRKMQKRFEEKNLLLEKEIDERKKAEVKLRKLSRAVEHSASSIVITNLEGMIEYVNPAFSETTGYSFNEAIGNNPSVLKSGKHQPEFYKKMWQTLNSGNVWHGEFVNKRKNGSIYWEYATISPVKDQEGNITNYVAIKDDITRRKETEKENIRLLEEARAARSDAENANRAKSEFLANMSHEIRTPMNAVIGMTDLTLQTNLNQEQSENLQSVKDSAHHLLDIINDILDFSKIEAGKITLENTDFDLHKLLDSVIGIFSFQVERQGLFLDLVRADDLPRYIRGDQVRLKQILVNLIGNAVKFTETGGITVKAKCQKSPKEELSYSEHVDSHMKNSVSNVSNLKTLDYSILFSVADTGIGIPKDRQEKIFESFSQASDSTTRKYGGTGLGLSICWQLAGLMKGQIWVESKVGTGSKFSFLIDFLPGDKENIRPDYHKQRSMISGQASEALKILLAEDNPVNAKVASSFLTRMGHIPITAVDGKKVLKLLSSDIFDLVLMDVEMPGMSGIEATQRIRNGEAGHENSKIPVIAMTAHVLSDFREKCEIAGMNAFVSKPVDFYELGSIIGRHVSHAVAAISETAGNKKAETVSAADPVLDKKDILRRLGGNKVLFDTLCKLFIKEIPKVLENLRQAIANNNMDGILLYAHSLKGTCMNMSAKTCQNFAEQLERIAREGGQKSEQIIPLFEKLEQELDKVMDIIQRI
ncbi:response regulator [Desulfobacterales bacterium HSG16]|nr:response regulator [Desulfobacterales bacterium HSG16]